MKNQIFKLLVFLFTITTVSSCTYTCDCTVSYYDNTINEWITEDEIFNSQEEAEEHCDELESISSIDRAICRCDC